MWKKLISVVMTGLISFSLLTPLTLETASAASDPALQTAETRNVALNAAATASGQCNGNEGARYAVDGKNDTKWCDNSSTAKKWLKLDLGQVYNINRWVVKNAAINESANSPFWNTKSFRLQKSSDGQTWEDVDTVKDNVQSIVERYVPAFSSRYIRFYVDKAADEGTTVRLYELEIYGVDSDKLPAYPATNLAPVDYVDPFINTMGDNGQTNPGPTTPFGLVALGPDSDGGAFSGYYYQDKFLKGFSHLRFSGVGCSGGGGNILMMPETRSFTKNSSEYKQQYDKNSEQASPGYYGVKLASGIGVELTASRNVGFHRYTFPETDTGSVLIDLSNSYAGMVDANLTVENNSEISGMIQSKNVCGHGYYTMYYSIQFDHDFNSYSSWQGDAVGAEPKRNGSNSGVWVNFNTKQGKVIQAKVGLSPISVEQAKYERDHDIAGWDFDAQHTRARNTWSELLNKVEITDADETNKRIFYTQLYHSFLHPNNVTSSSGTFKAGRDENTIRQTSEFGDDFEYYNGWTTWDDFRKYSLFSLLEPKKFENMVKSLVDLYGTRGSYTQWGEGYWPSPTVRNEFNGAVILDAYSKGFTNFDVYKALKGMAIDADNFSISDGEISGKLEKANSASFPMKLAELIGDRAAYEKYKDLALSYKKLWNPKQVDEEGTRRGFFTPNGYTVAKGDVLAVDKYAYQGNLWTYRWSAPQDINGLAQLMGGKKAMAKELQRFFEINEYMAINEPDLHVPYLFNYLGYPYLTQYYVRQFTTEKVAQRYHNHGPYKYEIKSRVYRDDPEGYLPSMDDDAGGMSSWFVYSAMGLFPGTPGEAYFLIGSPIFSEVKLHLDNGKTFTIKANNVSSKNRFIKSAQLNGTNFNQAWIKYADIMSGGTLEFEMDSTPNTSWGAAAGAAPPTLSFTADVDNAYGRQALIAEQSEWKYFDKGQYAGDGWTSLGYDDSGWASGPAMLGYDSTGKVQTKVSYGPDAGNKYPTTYFRKTFEVADVNGIHELDAGLIRDDGAVVYLNGHEVFRTNMPAGEVKYGTYANATVNDERDRITFIVDPAYLVKGTNVLSAEVHQANASSSDIAFEFSLEAVGEMAKPAAPTEPVVDDKANTFGWTFVPGIEQAADYEYSTDGGLKWKPATSNPQTVGPLDYEAGKVQVRVKANESLYRTSGEALLSNAAYTSDIRWDVFDLKADVNRSGNMTVDVTGTLKGNYSDSATAVFQLMDGNEQALMSNAVPVQVGSFELSQLFNVNASKYQMNVYLVDRYNGNIYDSLWLAEPIVSKPETGAPSDPPPPAPEPLPEPLPLPVVKPEPEEPDDPGNEQPGEPDLTLEFENRTEWTSAVNTFNNKPLSTEAGNSGTVVANTFNGAWLAFDNFDFGTQGANKITVEYDAPTNRAPAGSKLEIRLNAVDGELIGTVDLPNTGSAWGTYKTAKTQLSKTVTGKQKLYVVMKGSTTSSLPYIGNFDRLSFEYQKIRNDFALLELEKYDDWSTAVNPQNNGPLKTENGKSGQQVANTFSGAWLAYKGMDFGSEGVNQLSIEYSGNTANCAADAAVEIRLGGVDGLLIGKIATPPTASGWTTYKTATGPLTQTITGVQDIYFVFTGSTDATYKYIGNFDNAGFSYKAPENPGGGQPEPDKVTVEFENKSEWTAAVHPTKGGALRVEPNNGGQVVANTFSGAWLSYKAVDFGTKGKNHMTVVYDAPVQKTPADAAAEIRLGGIAGILVGTVNLTQTGNDWGTYKSAEADLTTTVTGKQDVYLVLKGSADTNHPYVGNLDSFTLEYRGVRTDFAKLELEKYDEWTTALNPQNNGPLKTENGKSGQQVANTFSGAWLAYKRMDFGSEGVNQFTVEYSGNTASCPADATVEVRLGGVNGTLVGKIATPPTANNWSTYKTATGALTQTVTGIQDVYLVLTGTGTATYKYIGNFDNASFSLSAQQPEADVTVELEAYTAWSPDLNTFNSKPLKTEANNGGTVVANTFNGAWMTYQNVDFGTKGKNYVEMVYDAPSQKAPADVKAEIRLNDKDGPVIGVLALPNTGSGWGTYKTAGVRLDQLVTGKATICVVFKGSTTTSLMYVGNLDRMKFSKAN
ncbi:glycoside hydrolase domain-containing protein [Paenibacillus hamazuiensis]|uniref:glycoside hydrolase domain-containing protein n=1 Tax=Paenibacillus hamazuiensis TaxID=2936508 RepID=UPI00200F8CEB|nr:glycoside hydrolase domain-containing protein [Paenibacillus hamazuiensis]